MVIAASLPGVADVQPFAKLTAADHRKLYSLSCCCSSSLTHSHDASYCIARIEKVTKPLSETTKKETPAPLHLVVYALRFATHPTIVHAQIPDILRLLAHVEAVRLNIISLAPGLLSSVATGAINSNTASTWIRILCGLCIYVRSPLLTLFLLLLLTNSPKTYSTPTMYTPRPSRLCLPPPYPPSLRSLAFLLPQPTKST